MLLIKIIDKVRPKTEICGTPIDDIALSQRTLTMRDYGTLL